MLRKKTNKILQFYKTAVNLFYLWIFLVKLELNLFRPRKTLFKLDTLEILFITFYWELWVYFVWFSKVKGHWICLYSLQALVDLWRQHLRSAVLSWVRFCCLCFFFPHFVLLVCFWVCVNLHFLRCSLPHWGPCLPAVHVVWFRLCNHFCSDCVTEWVLITVLIQ